MEQLRSLLAGEVPRPPISHLTGMHIVEVGDGTAAFAMPVTDWLRSPQGAISIGPLAIPADAAVACSILTKLPPATPFSTSELSLRLLAPVKPGGSVVARGQLVQLRRRLALAEVSVWDDDERLIAHGSSLCFIQPQLASLEPPPSASEEPAPDGEPAATPDPYERPVQGGVIDQDVWDRVGGLEVLEAQIAGKLPLSPIHYLTGLSVVAASVEGADVTLPATEWLCAPARRRVQGGAVATLAEAALSSAIQSRLPAATALAPIDLKVNYLRPLPADGRLAYAHGQVQHVGRTIAVASAEVLDADGRLIALATGSAMVLPGRPASLGALED